ncbi:type II/IV secretion system protein [Clostridium tarantellae]|uniref:Type II/IV secretion system protein n=1 Tax=Clostridium tarantellae TaxID=39493 RepID=A0A6I1MNM2_9CLOT|nr:type II/IV secretion system protein [Clostridium tarantellae]
MNYTLKDIDLSYMKSITKDMMLDFKIISLGEKDGTIYFYTDYSKESEKKSYLSLMFKKNIKLIKDDEEKVISLINSCYGNEINFNNKDEFVIHQLSNILSNAIDLEASDIHLEPQSRYVNIRFRIDGTLIMKNKIQHEEYLTIINKIKLDSNMDISDKLRPQDGKMRFKFKEKFYDLRVSSIPTLYGEKLVLRVLYKKPELANINKLNLSFNQLEKIKKLLAYKHGMILINGPTGSGKTTTLYALLNEVNKEDINISTIEDPIEFNLNGITQTNVNEKNNITFSNGLRHILRQDPDIILIGEIRDEETAQIGTRAAITGHKVLSTIHTNSGYEVYSRLKDMGVHEYLLKEALKGVITQRLVRKLCDYCKKKYDVDENFINQLSLNKKSLYYKSCGCEKCNYTGYKGRIMICEIMLKDELEKVNIKNNEMLENCLNMMEKGIVSLEEYILLKEGEGF